MKYGPQNIIRTYATVVEFTQNGCLTVGKQNKYPIGVILALIVRL